MTASSGPGPTNPRSNTPPYQRGDVVLVPFPFSERLAEKQRPAVVLSADFYWAATGDLIIAQVTSRVSAPSRPGDHRLRGWRDAGLPLPSLVRARVATIHQSRVRKRLGALPSADLRAVEQGLRDVLGL